MSGDVERLEREVAALREQLAAMKADPGDFVIEGCGDHSCMVRKPTGMATNGRCRCDLRTVGRAMKFWRHEARRWTAAYEELKKLYVNSETLFPIMRADTLANFASQAAEGADPARFWGQLTPRQVANLLKGAPKVLEEDP